MKQSFLTIAVALAAFVLFASTSFAQTDNSVSTGQTQWTVQVERPISVTSGGEVFLGVIAPGTQRTLINPSSNFAINFTIAGAPGYGFQITGSSVQKVNGDVTLGGIQWESKTVNAANWTAVDTKLNGSINGTPAGTLNGTLGTTTNTIQDPDGQYLYRVYPASIEAAPTAEVGLVEFEVSLTAEYTNI